MRNKRLIATISAIVVSANLYLGYRAVKAQDASSIEESKATYQATGTFWYGGSVGDQSSTYYYQDTYFNESSYQYNQNLCTMSLCLAMSAFGSNEESTYENKSKNARQLFQQIGFDQKSIQVNDWYTVKPTTDSIGVIVANKPIVDDNQKYTLIALAIRGGGYEREWASNFTVGTQGQHAGFNDAKNQVIQYLKGYIRDQHITGDVKLWITGYSRAAATSNLVAGALDEGIALGNNVTYNLSDVYAYCFETPAGALTNEVKGIKQYENIFNIINSSDPVPYVAPSVMGFGRYGVDYYIPSAATSADYKKQKEQMLSAYYNLSDVSTYIVDDFQMKKIGLSNWLPGGEPISFIVDDKKNNYSQATFLQNYINIICKEFLLSRYNYKKNYEDEIREICFVFFGGDANQQEILINTVKQELDDNLSDIILAYVNPFKSEDEALQIVADCVKKGVRAANITGYNEEMLNRASKNLADLILAVAANHPNYSATLISNMDGIGQAHYPQLCLAWMQSMDSNYNKNAKNSLNDGSYRMIQINHDVNVTIHNKDGNLVASIQEDKPKTMKDSNIITAINEDDEKIIYLPSDEEYNITIKANKKGSLNYSISEYSAVYGEYTRVENYFDVKMDKNESVYANIPEYKESDEKSLRLEGSTTDYTLKDCKDRLIRFSSNLKGIDAATAYYIVEVSTEDEEKGVVSGQGVQPYGSFAKVVATAKDGHEFLGWYCNDKLVSKKMEYSFCVKKNVKLVARFK